MNDFASTSAAPLHELPPSPPQIGAGFGVRAAARLIDWGISMIIAFVAAVIAGIALVILNAAGVVGAGWEERVGGFSALGFVLGLVASTLYHAIAEAGAGATLGKLCLGLRVVRLDGKPASFGATLIRNLAWLIDSFFFGLVAYQRMSQSELRQRYGDAWAKTLVVSKHEADLHHRRDGLMMALAIFGAVTVDGLLCVANTLIQGW